MQARLCANTLSAFANQSSTAEQTLATIGYTPITDKEGILKYPFANEETSADKASTKDDIIRKRNVWQSSGLAGALLLLPKAKPSFFISLEADAGTQIKVGSLLDTAAGLILIKSSFLPLNGSTTLHLVISRH